MPRSSAPAEPVKVRTELVGTSPMAVHNVRLANPDDAITKAISKVTSKRTITEEDRQEKFRLEFLGGLYVHENEIVIPKMNVRRCFQEAAKITKKGRDVARALSIADPEEPAATLVFEDMTQPDGTPTTPEQLWALDKYADVTMVRVGTSKVPRCRPVFYPWGLTIDWLLLPSIMDYDDFASIVKSAGLIEGLNDNRIGGYGRFSAKVTRL